MTMGAVDIREDRAQRQAPLNTEARRGGPPTLVGAADLRRRHWRVVTFFAVTVFHFLWWDVLLRWRWLSAFRTPWVPRWRRITRRYKSLALELQGLWIKLGQFLSTRVDILPLEITSELESLQDEVPAEPVERILDLVEKEFRLPAR